MGVHGLWRLIEPSGKPVPLETLENKILAVDVSIWLHQAIKGFQDSKGAPIPNAHLLGIYHRVCKLLYFKIKPIFVFDGGVPALKKQTIAKRNQLKSRNFSEAERLQKELLSTLMKHSAISSVLSEKAISSIRNQTKTSKNDMYVLPTPEHDSTLSSSEDEGGSTSDTTDSSPTKNWDLHTIDMSSRNFKSLPVDVRHEILTELKETRKQNSWGRIHEIPKQSGDFSTYQMKRLLQRQSVQAALDEASKEMGGASLSLAELESLLKDQGIPTTNEVGQRIASDENTRYLYIKDVKQAIERARKEQLEKESIVNEDSNSKDECVLTSHIEEEKPKTNADLEEEEDLQKAIALSLEEVPSTSKENHTNPKLQFSFLEGFNDGDFQSDSSDEDLTVPVAKKVMSSAAGYMMEYSGLTPNEIQKIIGEKTKNNPIKNNMKVMTSKGKYKNLGKVIEDEKNNEVIVLNCDEDTTSIVPSSIIENVPDKQNTNISNKDISIKTKESVSDIVVMDIESNDKETVDKRNFEQEPVELSSSDSDDFMEVSDVPEVKQDDLKNGNESIVKPVSKDIFQIEIDPSKTAEADDLFDDIFVKCDTKEINLPEILINHKNITDNHLLSDNVKLDKKHDPVPVVENKEMKLETQKTVKDEAEKTVKPTQVSVNIATKINTGDENEIVKVKELVDEGTAGSKKLVTPQLSIQKMTEMRDELQKEKIDLLVEKSNKERLASNITDQMYKEAQELLELFGVPYIIAPMEAEAQCAFLDSIELTDGTITDDSDIWLFGGRTVYKNFFNQSKYVMEFNAENIKHHFKLNREQLILLALLVGSDYTTGIQGIGPVTALEILSAFPPGKSTQITLSQSQLVSGLKEFKAWFTKGKKGGVGRASLRSKLKNIDFSENFPSLQVVEAYLDPKVETSDEKFSWSKPDIISLTIFARDKFGWSPKKTDEILKPIIKRMEESQSQKSIKDFFKTRMKVHSTNVEEKLSKRVRTALDRFGKSEEELIAEEMLLLEKEENKSKKATKRRAENSSKAAKTKNKETEEVKMTDVVVEDKDFSPEDGPKAKCSRKRAKGKNKEVDEVIMTVGGVEDKDFSSEDGPKTKHSRKRRTVKNEDTSKPKDDTCIQDKISSKKRPDTSKGQSINRNNPDLIEGGNGSQKEPLSGDTSVETVDELTLYANIAAELKIRTKRNNELKDVKGKKEDSRWKKKKQPPKLMDAIPEELKNDEDIQMLIATTAMSVNKVDAIDRKARDELNRSLNSDKVSKVVNIIPKPQQEIIHQRLRNKSDLLRNKMKAIEVFRRSKKGPGYVAKGARKRMLPKEDAELSEDSD